MNAFRYPVIPVSDGVQLRPFAEGDVDMLQDLATDAYVPLISSLPARADRAEVLAYIERQHARLDTGAGFSFCVADLGGVALGTAGLWLDGRAQGRATLGYAVVGAARGRGVAARALRALVGFAWTLDDLFRLELYIEPWNVASTHTAERVGFAYEGLLRSHQPIGDRRADMQLWSLVRPAPG